MDRLTSMDAFVRVVDAGSFSAAARRWGKSKATVSKHVSALEAHLGVALLQRTTRSLRLTDAGHQYYERCVEVLGEIEQMESSLHEAHQSPRGVLRMTAPPGFVSRYRALITSEFVARYPGVQVDLQLTHRMVNLVEEGFDVAIRITEPEDSSLIARRIAAAPLCLAAAPSYLEAHGVPSSPADLVGHQCLVDTNFRAGARWRFVVDGDEVVVTVSGPFRANHPVVLRELALEGHGIVLSPHFVVEEALREGALIPLLEGMIGYNWSIYVVFPQRRYVPARVRAFVDWVSEVFGEGSR